MGYLIELLIDLFGENWLSHGKMDLKFIAVVDVGDRLVPKAVIISKESEGPRTKFSLEIWCEDQRGNKVTIGTAMGLI